ncbi:hypothetical protein TNCV_1311591 [Trichonephila clavipes]|nr:hypothetical protein TNCV_1311591 [Trichonephila clavipes]
MFSPMTQRRPLQTNGNSCPEGLTAVSGKVFFHHLLSSFCAVGGQWVLADHFGLSAPLRNLELQLPTHEFDNHLLEDRKQIAPGTLFDEILLENMMTGYDTTLAHLVDFVRLMVDDLKVALSITPLESSTVRYHG